MACIEARGLRKAFGKTVALDGINMRVEEGRILGLIGPNGAGKTTALNAFLGLTSFVGELRVLGRDPWRERDHLMRDVCFIADVAVLPRWIRVSQVLDYLVGIHPRFDRAKAEALLAKTTIRRESKVRELSEVMVHPEQLAAARALKPMHERQVFGRSVLLFDLSRDSMDGGQLANLGDVRTPSVVDLFVAVMGNGAGETHPSSNQGAAK